MKQPKVTNLKKNSAETERIRESMKGSSSVKITINVDAESLSKLRNMSKKSGVPYQRLLNSFLRESLAQEDKSEARLDKLEREIEKLKRKLVA